MYILNIMKTQYPHKIYDFIHDINPLGTATKVKNRIRKAIKNLNSYNDLACKQFLNYLQKTNNITESEILIGHGSTDLLKKILKVSKTKKVLIPFPIHNRYNILAEKWGIEIIPFSAGVFFDKVYNLEWLKKNCDKAELIILPNPHNVTGKIIDKDQWDELVWFSKEKKKIIIVDESLLDYLDIASEINKIRSSDYLLILRTFSTFYGLAGMPFGYLIGSKYIISYIQSDLGCDFYSVPYLAYIASKTALKDKHFKKRTMEFIKKEKAYIVERLKSCGSINVIDTGCNFLLLKVCLDDIELKDGLKKRNVLVDVYNTQEGLFIRFPIRKHKYNAYFVKTLKSLTDKKDV